MYIGRYMYNVHVLYAKGRATKVLNLEISRNGTSVALIIGSAIGYRPIIAIVQYIGCLSDSTYRYSIYAVVYFFFT